MHVCLCVYCVLVCVLCVCVCARVCFLPTLILQKADQYSNTTVNCCVVLIEQSNMDTTDPPGYHAVPLCWLDHVSIWILVFQAFF